MVKKAKPAKRKAKARPATKAEDWSFEAVEDRPWEVDVNYGTFKAGEAIGPALDPESCGNCHFQRDGQCKRYPPEKREGHALASHRTTVAADEWCGEWRHA